MNRLRQMSIFAHVVEAGSISGAALKLDLSKSVISQHLKSLEQELEVSLLKRTTRRQTLTSAGEAFYQRCKTINAIASEAWEQAKAMQDEPQGPLRITAPHALMDSLVAPVVTELMHRYPKLKPELINHDQHLNLMQHNVDVAIRVGNSKDSNLKQKRLGDFRDVLCAKAGVEFTNIQSAPYIANQWQGKAITHQFLSPTGKAEHYQTEASCLANSFHSCLSLIRAGAGIGIIPDFYLATLAPELINLFPDKSLPLNPVYALTPFQRNTPIAVQMCIAAVEQRLSKRLV